MNIVKKVVLVFMVMFLVFVYVGEVKVKWYDFNDYCDVCLGNNLLKGVFYKNVVNNFEKYFNKLVEKLFEGYIFNVEVIEFDLVGDVCFGIMNELCIIKLIYFLCIDLNYLIIDKNGKVVSEVNDVKFKDMGFMDCMKMGCDEVYYYDKCLIIDWFEDELLLLLNFDE